MWSQRRGCTFIGVMVEPSEQRLRLVRSRMADPERVARLVASRAWLDAAVVLKQDGASSVLAGRMDGRETVVKSLAIRGVAGLLRRAFGFTRGLRQWRGAELLMAKGFATSEPLVLFRSGGAGGDAVETLVMEREAGESLIDVISTGGLEVRQEHALARACGGLVRAMCRGGLRNRDLKPSNVVAAREGENWRLVQIDTVGVRDDADFGHAPEMLFRLMVEPLGLGCLPRRSVRMRVVRGCLEGLARDVSRRRVRELWAEVEKLRAGHGDATPRVDPRR